jgi:hypothetical protein
MNELEMACPREAETAAAERSGAWTAELREHARHCPDCAASTTVHEALHEYAASLRAVAAPAAAEALLWRARLRARVEHAERAARPVAWFDRVALAVAAAIGLLAALWRGSAVFEWLGHTMGGKVAASPSLVALVVVLSAFTGAVLWIFGNWAEE